MKGATMLTTLQKLGIAPSFSRPGVSDDNAQAEAFFRTLKVTGNYAASSAPTSATRTKASAAGSERTVLSRPVA
ncbi:MAG: hypothetical protein IPH85_00075 [Ignavibacteria bacterium]|nr:hypothetical protein [Ignavibacteria bacterium]